MKIYCTLLEGGVVGGGLSYFGTDPIGDFPIKHFLGSPTPHFKSVQNFFHRGTLIRLFLKINNLHSVNGHVTITIK